MRTFSIALGGVIALALGTSAVADALNPQPLPPGRRTQKVNTVQPATGHTQLNPQPEPPGRRINQDAHLPPGPCKTAQGAGKPPKMACTQAARH